MVWIRQVVAVFDIFFCSNWQLLMHFYSDEFTSTGKSKNSNFEWFIFSKLFLFKKHLRPAFWCLNYIWYICITVFIIWINQKHYFAIWTLFWFLITNVGHGLNKKSGYFLVFFSKRAITNQLQARPCTNALLLGWIFTPMAWVVYF